jgi:hypothetical protein
VVAFRASAREGRALLRGPEGIRTERRLSGFGGAVDSFEGGGVHDVCASVAFRQVTFLLDNGTTPLNDV